ncbi:DNA-processing protein DprA [uncultured Treponema sp.]|uniref:DNA-processing protein DprA n=1 Tax=uncultured Treponema sp. TaxID=162155 RepID=UPI0025CFFA6F|nr:DNA-processing protein DprA [uncultured Treponema sp.]
MDILDIAISSITFLSAKEKILLKKNIDSMDNLALLSIEELSTIIGRSLGRAVWNGNVCRAFAEKSFSLAESKGVNSVFYYEAEFPAMLRTIPDPPYAFFYRGTLEALKKPCVSVVGTRRVCEKTARAAFGFAKEAAFSAQTVISGLANGIDSFAHKGALASGILQSTAAILPCGIDTVVPYGNRSLAQQIVKDGGFIASEYVPGIPAEPWRFVQRNRLVAALSSCTVVVHAPAGSGALITADFALDYNRDVVFHSAGFCSEAKKNGHGGKKNVRTSEKFIEEGAPVIENYADFVTVRKNAPGFKVCKNKGQLEFFDSC